MDTFFRYAPYYFLAMFIVLSIATGLIFSKKRNKDNALIFLAFAIFTFTLLANIFFGYSAIIDYENNIETEEMGLLSLNQTQALQLLAVLFMALGFVSKAFRYIKKA